MAHLTRSQPSTTRYQVHIPLDNRAQIVRLNDLKPDVRIECKERHTDCPAAKSFKSKSARMLIEHCGMCCTGEVRVFAEVYPDTVCYSVTACQFSVSGGNQETLRVNARAEVPFAALSDKPQLRECFIVCTLPALGSRLDDVSIEGSDGQTLVTWPVEVENLDLLPFAGEMEAWTVVPTAIPVGALRKNVRALP